MKKEFWDERYANEIYAYGEEPNEFLLEQLAGIPPGEILFPAEGEGRNAVYAAKLGWHVSAFDQSREGKKKALKLAVKNKVEMDYQVGTLPELDFKQNQFDAIALIYAHFSKEQKSVYHQILDQYLRIGGLIILEAFSKKHLEYVNLNPKVGGPKDLGVLYSMEEITADFPTYEILLLEETEVELNEGICHLGTGSVVRFVGRKC